MHEPYFDILNEYPYKKRKYTLHTLMLMLNSLLNYCATHIL